MRHSNLNKLPDIYKTRIINDSIEKVWKSVSTSEGIALWFVSNDFQPVEGHEFYLDMHKPQGKTACKVTLIEPPKRLIYDVGQDWSWSFELNDLGSRTELTYIWSGWDVDKVSEIGIPHSELHAQLLEGTNVLMKSLVRSVKKYNSIEKTEGGERMQKVTLNVNGMACGNCTSSIEKALKAIGASGKASLKHRSVTIEYDANKISLEGVKDTIEDLGYDMA